MSSPNAGSTHSTKSSVSPRSNTSSTSSAKSIGQYLHPDFVEQVQTPTDPKQSPLALLVKTCDSIGKSENGGEKNSARNTPMATSRPNSHESNTKLRSSPLLMKKEAAKQAVTEDVVPSAKHSAPLNGKRSPVMHKSAKSPGSQHHPAIHPYHPFLSGYGSAGSHFGSWGIPEGHTAAVCACPHCVHARTLMEYLYGSCLSAPAPAPLPSPPTPQAEFCIYCGKHCPTPEELVRHMRSHDTPSQPAVSSLPMPPFYPPNLSPTARDSYRKWSSASADSHRFHPYRSLFSRLPFPHYGAPLV